MATEPKSGCGLGCLGIIILCVIIGGISSLVSSSQANVQASAPQSRTESSAESFCEQQITDKARNALDIRGNFLFKHLGVGNNDLDYKVTSVLNAESISLESKQSRWICRLFWAESIQQWVPREVYTTTPMK